MNQAISYIMPAYNCGNTIVESITSIIDGNLLDNDEIVVVNDGSSDDTKNILVRMAQKYKCIRIIDHKHNRGGAVARNTAVENARYDLIFCLDSDNLLVPGSVIQLRDFLLAEAADVVAFSELHYFKSDPNEITHKWRYRPGVISFADYLSGAVVPGASGNYLYTRASWLRAKGYPESSGALDTWGFGLRQLASGQRMMVMQDGFYKHRYGHESYWVRESKTGRVSLGALQILIPYLDRLLPRDVDYIMSHKHRYNWFDNLDVRPLCLSSGEHGAAAAAYTTDDKIISSVRSHKNLSPTISRLMRLLHIGKTS